MYLDLPSYYFMRDLKLFFSNFISVMCLSGKQLEEGEDKQGCDSAEGKTWSHSTSPPVNYGDLRRVPGP